VINAVIVKNKTPCDEKKKRHRYGVCIKKEMEKKRKCDAFLPDWEEARKKRRCVCLCSSKQSSARSDE
jgi:hypothetical protein